MGFFTGEKKKVTQEPLYTKEQKSALESLLGYARSGKYGGYTAGQEYGDPLGAYDVSALEKLGGEEYRKLLSTDTYDPYSEKGVYKGFKRGVLREEQEASDRLMRDMAVTGGLYSKETGKQRGLLGERAMEQLTGKQAELYDIYGQRKLAGAEKAFQYGGLERELESARSRDKYTDWLRGRQEKLGQIDALAKVAQTSIPWGAKEMEYTEASGLEKLFGSVLGFGTAYFGAKGRK